jgi:hypothetical protein
VKKKFALDVAFPFSRLTPNQTKKDAPYCDFKAADNAKV